MNSKSIHQFPQLAVRLEADSLDYLRSRLLVLLLSSIVGYYNHHIYHLNNNPHSNQNLLNKHHQMTCRDHQTARNILRRPGKMDCNSSSSVDCYHLDTILVDIQLYKVFWPFISLNINLMNKLKIFLDNWYISNQYIDHPCLYKNQQPHCICQK